MLAGKGVVAYELDGAVVVAVEVREGGPAVLAEGVSERTIR